MPTARACALRCAIADRADWARWSSWWRPVICTEVVSKGFIPRQDTGVINGNTRAGRHHLQRDDPIPAADRRYHSEKPECRFRDVHGGAGHGRGSGRQRRTLHHPPEADARAHSDCRRGHSGNSQGGLAGVRACGCFCPTRRPSASAARCPRATTCSRCRDPNCGACTVPGRSSKTGCKALPILQDVATNLELRNPEIQVSILRDQASALGITPQQIAVGAPQRVRRAPGQHRVWRGGPVSGDAGARPALPGGHQCHGVAVHSESRLAPWCRSAPWRKSRAASGLFRWRTPDSCRR